MFTAGGTGGGPGAPCYNLALAQFQQMVADAERDCRRCNGNDCKARKYCKKLVQCKFCTCARGQNELGGGDFSRSCCSRAKQSLSSCSSNRSCDRCCGQCRYRSRSSRSRRSSSSSSSVQPAPVAAVVEKKVE